MKHIVVLSICFCISVIFWAGCRKSQNNKIQKIIVGTWELRKTTAAMNPNATTYPEGNGNIYKFTANNYEKYINGVLARSGTYQIVEDPGVSVSVCLVIPSGQYSHRIVFDNNSTEKEFLQIINGNLSFISGCYAVDAGHTSEYKKQ